tara:strand:- start:5027 stop:5230 length:204 start_codon:yes stop_codon:yes gene_type:complete
MAKSREEIHIGRIEGGIRAIRGGRKSPEQADIGKSLNILKTLNEPMYDDLLSKYKRVVEKYKIEVQY